ncbi:MAG: RNA polymerase sigma factor [Bacteroidota bacterium]
MQNPLKLEYTESLDRELVQKALDGDRQALEQLIQLHQPFIYNVAWKMVHDPNDALDLTQEVLIKVITKLSQFKFKSSFRTWLYRIVMNEFLQAKRRKTETQFTTFEDLGERLDAIPNAELNREEEIVFEELSKEMQVRCMSGMLMCLTREQRLIFIVGDSYGVDHTLGAEIFEISKQNFRVKLHRARQHLYNYMQNKCGLVNKDNPCRCPKKAKTLKKMGVLDEEKMTFTKSFQHSVADYAEANYQEARDVYDETITTLFREHPARTSFDRETFLNTILKDNEFLKFFE